MTKGVHRLQVVGAGLQRFKPEDGPAAPRCLLVGSISLIQPVEYVPRTYISLLHKHSLPFIYCCRSLSLSRSSRICNWHIFEISLEFL